MNASLLTLEYLVLGLALLLLAADLFLEKSRQYLGHVSALGLTVIFALSLNYHVDGGTVTGFLDQAYPAAAFEGAYLMDNLALFFKKFFLLAGVIVALITIGYSKHIEGGISEYFVLQLFALIGMMFAASANNFMLLFVALELITVTFYILVSYHRRRVESLEAGVKYLIMGALSSGFLVYGIALVYGSTGTMEFSALSAKLSADHALGNSMIVQVGLLMIFVSLAFKLAAVPMQVWAADVYHGAPSPTTAFLAVGSKAAGVVLLLRLLGSVATDVARGWELMLMVIAGLTILYGSLCALPQRNIKRMMGYSSVASAGFLLMGFAVMTDSGATAVLYYLFGYLFTVLAAFTVIAVIVKQAGLEDVNSLAGLGQRSPVLAATLTLSMVSLAGVPPLAGFFGKFLIFKAVLEQALDHPAYFALLACAVLGVLISIYYYFNIVRAIYWSRPPADLSPITVDRPVMLAVVVCVGGMIGLGIYPDPFLEIVAQAVTSLSL